MVLTKREKNIAMAIGVLVAGFLVYQYAVEPYFNERARIAGQRADLQREINKAGELFKNSPRVDRNWRELLATGLKADPAEAESQAVHTLDDLARAARVDVQAVKPDRAPRAGDFIPIRLQASGNANTGALATLLYQLETAALPLRISELRMTSRKDGTDDLAFQLNVSTAVFSPQPETRAAKKNAGGPAR